MLAPIYSLIGLLFVKLCPEFLCSLLIASHGVMSFCLFEEIRRFSWPAQAARFMTHIMRRCHYCGL